MSLIILPGADKSNDWSTENGKEVVCLHLNRGAVVLIDAADAEKVSGKVWTWNGKYAAYKYPTGSGYDPYVSVYLHRFLMDAPDGVHVDHINGNTLDNRRCNLRLCTHAENRRNQKMRKDCKTGFKGVCFHPEKNGKKWHAFISVNKKKISLRYHLTAEEAALAYNKAALIYHGEFARLNEVNA